MAKRSFSPALFSFLRELRRNNNREWFAANKRRYEDAVLEPAIEFIADFAPFLREISPHFRADARPTGGSLFRIYRDTRFSRDKTPFKTHAALQFRHRLARDAHAPGFYLHLEPGNVMAAVGIWHPDGATLRKIRDAIVAEPKRWTRITRGKPFAGLYRLGGDSVKRPPHGYDAEHPLIEDLKRKDFYGFTALPEKAVTSEGFLESYASMCRAGAPLARFLCEAIGVPF